MTDVESVNLYREIVTYVVDSVAFVSGFKGTWDHEPYDNSIPIDDMQDFKNTLASKIPSPYTDDLEHLIIKLSRNILGPLWEIKFEI